MSYTIPSKNQIENALNEISKKFNTVDSQKKLKELIEKEINVNEEFYQISGPRLRSIAIESNLIKLEIHSREGDPKKSLSRCPICKNNLNRVRNQTIWGGKVTLEFRCRKCGYWTGKKKRIPTRYVFHFNKNK
jgi:uncharacterized protein with PIN domain